MIWRHCQNKCASRRGSVNLFSTPQKSIRPYIRIIKATPETPLEGYFIGSEIEMGNKIQLDDSLLGNMQTRTLEICKLNCNFEQGDMGS